MSKIDYTSQDKTVWNRRNDNNNFEFDWSVLAGRESDNTYKSKPKARGCVAIIGIVVLLFGGWMGAILLGFLVGFF